MIVPLPCPPAVFHGSTSSRERRGKLKMKTAFLLVVGKIIGGKEDKTLLYGNK